MKKLKLLFVFIVLLCLTGCFKESSMDDINILTSAYPIEYVVNYLYGTHSTINSIYPKDDDINTFKVTNALLDQYVDNELFIFNGLTDEKKSLKYINKKNKNLKIIDVTSNMNYEYKKEELWLDPNNLLTIANNIRKGFKEYINSKYLTNEIDENYNNLKINLTSLDGTYFSTVKNASNTTIVVNDDCFKVLEKYGITVISIDPDTASNKTIEEAKDLIKSGTCNYLFIKYKDNDDNIDSFITETNAKKLELYAFNNLNGVNTEKNDYITLMNQNLENLKLELYK
ncbi:MAG: metal ABC transporter substrate-binding protein [bacterium]|nr:metal ABC transporter substrate-binding protein [bacterium]